MVQKLNLPTYNFRIKKQGDQYLIWDDIRKKDIVLTPEEWVRQNFVAYLNQELGYPKSLMQLESGLRYNKLHMRSDILCYNQKGTKILLVECKRPTISLSQETFDQISRYNKTLNVPLMTVTNGIQHIHCTVNHNAEQYYFIRKLPHYKDVIDVT